MPVTLKRRYKRRYILVLYRSSSEELLSMTRGKTVNMFGYVFAQKASLKLIDKIGPDLHVIRCRSEFLGEVLCALMLIGNEHSAVVLDVSGTLRSLRSRAVIKKDVIEAILSTTSTKC
ncbi:MAG: Rpp14/Pop5 family protein [Nitrososphaeraceae archaeon]